MPILKVFIVVIAISCESWGGLATAPVELRRLLGFLAGFGIGLLLVHDPGVRQVEQLGHRQQIVEAEAVAFLPGILALLVAAAGNDAVPVALVAVVAPDGDLQDADADSVCGLGSHRILLLFS